MHIYIIVDDIGYVKLFCDLCFSVFLVCVLKSLSSYVVICGIVTLHRNSATHTYILSLISGGVCVWVGG